MKPILLYGATGYTGKLVARELTRRELPFVVSGRDSHKLLQLTEEAGSAIEARVATVDSHDSLLRAMKDVGAVINCAGPFTLYGEPVVKAAIEARAHYLDTTGEQAFMQRVIAGYDGAARRAGVALINAIGFDYAPGDCAAQVAADGLEPVKELTIAYTAKGMGTSRGTQLSLLQAIKSGSQVFEGGRLQKAPLLPPVREIEFPKPIGPRSCTLFPGGEVLTVPMHTKVDTIVELVDTATYTSKAVAKVLPYAMPLATLFLKTPLHRLLERSIASRPEGPADDMRKQSRFTVLAKAESAGGSRTVTVEGSDPYGLTAFMAVEGALRVSEDLFDVEGASSPAAAFGGESFLDTLQGFGVRSTVEDRTEILGG